EWARQTETGDRTEIEDLPDDLPFWGEISATSENCVGTDCPQYDECFVTRMRRQAAESDLVIVNHHLLCADAAVRQSAYGEVIPACHYAVIDEAHQLEDVATQYFGVSISTYRLERLVGDATRYLDRDVADTRDAADHARADLDRIERLSVLFFGAVQRHLPSADRTRLDADILAPVMELGRRLSSALRALEDTVAPLTDHSEDLRSLGRRARELGDQIDFVLDAADIGFVYFLERRGRGVFLRASPVDVSSIIRELLLERMNATVLTSATLAVDKSFAYQRSRLGILDAAEIRLTSEFDYADQTVLYLPSDMPEPRAPDFTRAAADHITALLEATRGRAFVLFTSYANLRHVHQLIATSSRFPLLVQGTAPRSVLLRNFRATPNAVLLATSSFWQGVDVAGDTLSCVIIDKLPFTPPGDPITAARMDAIARDGGSPFSDYQVPLAILTLLQGIGRLIRHRQDRGVLSILDPRMLTKAYGRRFLASLPPSPIVRNIGDVQEFLSRKGM
ncbi:MAG: ATP-dependent DNA helicase, partial [Vicinamibacterales bacterium]|nr:ATP-dependent DNA helicase [Vicinamibacterales bacterium]